MGATSLSLDHDTPLTAINDALAQAREALKVHEQAVRKLLADRDAWLKRWATFEVEHQSLAKHPGVVAQATLLSAITGIVDDGQKAKLDADKLVFTPEPDALSALMLRLKDVREHADAASRYLTMRQARQIAVNAVNADLHQAEANKSRKAAADCLLEAQKLAVSKDYKNAEAQLQRIPDLLHKAWQQSQAQQNYDYWLDEYKTKIFDAVDKLDDKYKKHLGVELDPLRAALAQADTHAKAPDILRAALVMGELGKLAAAARSMADAVVAYVDKRGPFDLEFKKFDGHGGLEGVQAFYDSAKADRDYADTAVLNREFSLASSVLEALQPKLVPQRLLADRYIPYKEKKTKVRQALDEVGRQTDAEGAATERAQAERYMTLAEQQQAAASARAEVALLDAADASLDAAQLQVDAAKSALSALKSFQGDPPAGEGLALLQARLQALPGRRQAVKAQGGDAFDPLIAPVENAEKALAQALAADSPDLAAAGLALDQAEKTLADAFAKALRKGSYDTLLPTVETLIKTTLPGLNNAPTDCLDKEIEELNRQLEEAKRQAQAPMLDFPSAMKTLNGAKVLADRALKKHEIFGLMQSELDAMKQLAEDLDKDPYKTGLDRELKRVRDLRAAIDKDLAAFNFPAAQKKAQAGAALDSPFRKLMTGYDQAVAARKTIYDTLKDELEGKPAAKVEFDMLTALRPNYDKIIDVDHVFAAAAKTVEHFNFYIGVARRALLRHEEYVTARKVQTDRLDVLKPQSNPGVQAAIEAAEKTIERADALDLARDFKQAQLELEPLKAKFDAIELDIPRYNAFHAARETARQRVAEARQHAQADFIEPLMLIADAKIRQAEAAAQRGEFKTAEDLCKEVPGDCDAAKSEADLYQPFTSGSSAGDDLKGLEEALKKVKLQWAELHTGRDADRELPERIVEASRQIKLAEKALPDQPAQAREHIEKAAADCAQARLHRLQFTQFLNESQRLVDAVKAFTKGPHKSAAFVDGRMKDLLPRIGAARSVMTAQGAQAAADALNDCTATYREHVALADRHLAYAQRRLGLEPKGQPTVLDEFEAHAQRHALAGDIADLRAALDEAAQAAEPTQPDLGRAMAALERAEGAAAAARLAIHMHTNPTPPDVKEVAKVLGQPKGAERLDALVAQLEPSARREVLQAAFEVRFGCKLALYKDGAEDIADAELGVDVARLYRDFAKLPPKHTLKNDSLLAVHDRRDATGYSGEGGASDFVPSTKELNMREGTASTSAGRNLGSAFALGKVQDGCEPENDEPVQFFDWNTLHEVGHTVEDRHQFMAARMGDKSYGGWTEYGGDLHAVAEKVVAKFKYDLEYTQALLAGETDPPLPDPPEKPQPVTAEVWEQRRMATLIWVKKAKFGTDPWETEATAQALKLEGEEIIHEAYDGYWYGYDAGARSQGLTGYQFRSPVEWFSEIYAAYYMKKLKPSHPATVWLKKLHKQ
ncbi:MAG: hypothetical protein MUC74_11355 [Ideonella sp.]|nr:hypothetical protein [Ideonella sp.]